MSEVEPSKKIKESLVDHVENQFDENKVLILSWVFKKSIRTHQWNKRWAVLRKGQFSYYKSSSEHKPSKVLHKSELLSVSNIQDSHDPHFAVYTSNRVYDFRVDTKELRDQWIESFESVVKQYDDDSNDEDEAEAEQVASSDLSQLSTDRSSGEYLVEQGQAFKLRRRYSQWKKYHILVTNKALYFCKPGHATSKPEKIVSIDDLLDVIEVDAMKGKNWCIMLITAKKRLVLAWDNEREMTKMLSATKAVVLQKKRS